MIALPTLAEETREWEIKGAEYKATMLSYDVEKGVQLKMAGNDKVGFVPLNTLGTKDQKYALRTYATPAVVQVICQIRQWEREEDDDDILGGLFRHRFAPPTKPASKDGWIDAGFGSGFMIGPRILITNHHVIRHAEKVHIQTHDNTTYKVDGALHLDPDLDLAVLRLAEIPEPALPPLTFHAGVALEIGEPVWTIGHPRGLKGTVSWGELNAQRAKKEFPEQMRPYIASHDEAQYLQTDAVILHGSSGSPLMDERGYVIGLNTFLFGSRIGVALHAKEFEGVAAKSLKDPNAKTTPFPLQPDADENPFLRYAPGIGDIRVPLLKAKKKFSTLEKEELWTLFDPPLATAIAAYDAVIENSEANAWQRFQARVYKVDALGYKDAPEQMPAVKKIADELLADGKTSAWLGYGVQQVEKGVGNLRNAFIKQIADEEKLSPENRFRVHAAFLKNSVERREKWKQVDDFNLKTNRDALVHAHSVLSEFIENEDPSIKIDPNELSMIEYLMEEVDLKNLEGTIALPFVATDYNGKKYDLDALRGNVVFLNFFSDECSLCQSTYHFMGDLHRGMTHRPFAVLAVNGDKDGVLKRLIKEKQITSPAIEDGVDGPLAKSWNVENHPAVFVIDHNGVIRLHCTGHINTYNTREFLKTLTDEAEKALGVKKRESIDDLPVPATSASMAVPSTLKKDLIVHYSFNNDSGTKVLDSSGKKTHGSRTEGVTYVAGKHGRSVRITGADTVVKSKDWDLNTKGWKGLSVAAWVRLEKETHSAYVFSRGSDDAENHFNVYEFSVGGAEERQGKESDIRSGSFLFRGTIHSRSYFGTSRPPLQEWTHVAGTSDGTIIRYFVNGKIDSESKVGYNPNQADSRFNSLVIGNALGMRSAGKKYVDGAIDEVMIWKRALSPEEVEAVHALAP